MRVLDQAVVPASYNDRATLADVWRSAGGSWIVTGSACYAQLQFNVQGQGQWTNEFPVPASGILQANTTGIRFRLRNAGGTATVSAVLSEPREPTVYLSSSGQITGPASLNVQVNGTIVGTEPTLDLIEGSEVVIKGTDDAANQRIQVSLYSPTFNVASFGTDPTGSTDNHAAIQACLTACIVAGGDEIYVPPGKYLVSSGSFDFSAASGTNRGVRFAGAGAGDRSFTQPGSTTFLNATGGTLFSAIANSQAQYLAGIVLQDFGIVNTIAPAAGTFQIDAQGVQNIFRAQRIVFDGHNFATGNAIRYIIQDGSWELSELVMGSFPGDNADTDGAAMFISDGTMPPGFTKIRPDLWTSESGNGTIANIVSSNVQVGLDLYGDLQGIHANSLSLNLTGTSTTNIGVRLRHSISGCVFEGVHTERSTAGGINLDSTCYGNFFAAGLLSTSDGSSGVICDGTQNEFHRIPVYGNAMQMTVGIQMTANADANIASAVIRPGGAGVLNRYQDTSTLGTNVFGIGLAQEIATSTKTTPTSVTVTSEAAAIAGGPILDLSSTYYDGSPIEFQFFSPKVVRGTTTITLFIYEANNAVVVGQIGVGSGSTQWSFRFPFRPPSHAFYRYQVYAYVDAGTGSIDGGAGGSVTELPMYFRTVRGSGKAL